MRMISIRLNQQTAPDGSLYYRASVDNQKAVSLEWIIDHITRTEYCPETITAICKIVRNEVYNQLFEGRAVDIGFGTLSFRVQGAFENEDDQFDPERHAVNIVFTPSPRLLQLERNMQVNPDPLSSQTIPRLNGIRTTRSIEDEGYMHSALWTDSQEAYLHGFNIRVAGDHPDVGVFFHSADGQTVAIPHSKIVMNQKELVGVKLEKPLAAGEWTVEIVTQFTPSYHLCKTPRRTIYPFLVKEHANN